LVAALVPIPACTDPSAEADAGIEGELEGPEYAPVAGKCDLDALEIVDPYVDCVESFSPAPEVSFGHDAMPEIVLGAPQGGGLERGGTHVASLGCGGSITLAFGEPWPTDGPGPDLVVFENAFHSGDITFVEPALVLLSEDGVRWHGLPCDPEGEDQDPPKGCAGLEPVLAAEGEEAIDPMEAGGDRIDLADLGLHSVRYVRIVDRTEEYYDSTTWCAGPGGGFDLDAVAGLGGSP